MCIRDRDVSPENLNDAVWLKENKPYVGELLLGHLRYGTPVSYTHLDVYKRQVVHSGDVVGIYDNIVHVLNI